MIYTWENQYNNPRKISEHYWEKEKIVHKLLIFLFQGKGDREGTYSSETVLPPRKYFTGFWE